MKKELKKSDQYISEVNSLFDEISQLIQNARQKVVQQANSALTLLNWQIGRTVNHFILKESRAEYGKKVIEDLSEKLTNHFGSGYGPRSIRRIVKFSKTYSDIEIVTKLSSQLSWSHFVELINIDDPLKRDFYTQMCCMEGWGIVQLRERLDSLLFERTAISKQPGKLIEKELDQFKASNIITPSLAFRDPYLLRFTGLEGDYSEKDLEDAILNELILFFYELGSDFCFVARQKRMSTEKTDRYLDLLFFHRRMKRLIALELKRGKFQPADKGQMEWYLRWLDKNERRPGEEAPLGIILCTEKDDEDIELFELDKNGIHVAQYLVSMPPKEIFESRLKEAIERAKERFSRLQQFKNQDGHK